MAASLLSASAIVSSMRRERAGFIEETPYPVRIFGSRSGLRTAQSVPCGHAVTWTRDVTPGVFAGGLGSGRRAVLCDDPHDRVERNRLHGPLIARHRLRGAERVQDRLLYGLGRAFEERIEVRVRQHLECVWALGRLAHVVAGRKRQEQIAARIEPQPAGARQPRRGPLREPPALHRQKRRVRRDDDDDRSRSGDGTGEGRGR